MAVDPRQTDMWDLLEEDPEQRAFYAAAVCAHQAGVCVEELEALRRRLTESLTAFSRECEKLGI